MSRYPKTAFLVALCCFFIASINTHLAADTPAEVAEQRILAALEKPFVLNIQKTDADKNKKISLGTLARLLKESYAIEVRLDKATLDWAAGLDADSEITIESSDGSLRTVLTDSLQGLDRNLDILIRDEVLWISTAEKAEGHLLTRAYDVSDLCQHPDSDSGIEIYNGFSNGFTPAKYPFIFDAHSLLTIITTTIAPHRWDDVGGPGSIAAYDNILIVNQSQTVFSKIEELLAWLRKLRTAAQTDIYPAWLMHGMANEDDFKVMLANQKWRNQLVTLSFNKDSLSDVVNILSKQFGLQVTLDLSSLKKSTATPDALVTGTYRNFPAHTALKLILQSVDPALTYRFHEDGLQITTKDTGEEISLIRRIYPVGDLTDADHFDHLIETITNLSGQEMWEVHGGSGFISGLPTFRAILILQPSEIHEDVLKLLQKLRAAKQQTAEQRNAGQETLPDGDLRSVVYQLRKNDSPQATKITSDEIMSLVRKTIEPGSWANPGVAMRSQFNRLFVRNTPAVHREIRRLLTVLELLDTNQRNP